MRYYKKITVLAALAVAAVGQMFAQNQSSPYSRYGYGLFSDYATSAQRNMGGVGVAMADGRQIKVPSNKRDDPGFVCRNRLPDVALGHRS